MAEFSPILYWELEIPLPEKISEIWIRIFNPTWNVYNMSSFNLIRMLRNLRNFFFGSLLLFLGGFSPPHYVIARFVSNVTSWFSLPLQSDTSDKIYCKWDSQITWSCNSQRPQWNHLACQLAENWQQSCYDNWRWLERICQSLLLAKERPHYL